jgi:hypothetical protein
MYKKGICHETKNRKITDIDDKIDIIKIYTKKRKHGKRGDKKSKILLSVWCLLYSSLLQRTDDGRKIREHCENDCRKWHIAEQGNNIKSNPSFYIGSLRCHLERFE